MITWVGFCVKIIEFVLPKAADRVSKLLPDDRRMAARALIRFYETLEDSDLILEDLLEVFDKALKQKKPILFSKDLVRFENQVTRLTEDAARQYDELVAAATSSASFRFDD